MVAPLWQAQPWFSVQRSWCPFPVPLEGYFLQEELPTRPTSTLKPHGWSFFVQHSGNSFRIRLRMTLAALRPSSTRHYQSHWKALQSFLLQKGHRDISESMALDFLSFLAHDKRRFLVTISTNLTALVDPLQYDWGIVLVTPLKRGLFHQTPAPRHPGPF